MNQQPSTVDSAITPPEAPATTRTFVLSDAHGCPELITAALEHGTFREGVDGFVYAGDFVDRGPDSAGCLRLIERYATQVLVGNHELAVLLEFTFFEQTSESRALRQLLLDRVLSGDSATTWGAVTSVDGVLVSHGGISESYASEFRERCEGSPELMARYLNREFVHAVRTQLETGERAVGGVLGEQGPLWFRPYEWGGGAPLSDVTQVVGHTPPAPELEAGGFFMVDPCAFWVRSSQRHFRYGLIEEGRVRVVQGPLTANRATSQRDDSSAFALAG